MNDEFLYRLRKDPPPRFAAQLKKRLDRQASQGSSSLSRSTWIRLLAAALLIGNSVLAIGWFVQHGASADQVPVFDSQTVATERGSSPRFSSPTELDNEPVATMRSMEDSRDAVAMPEVRSSSVPSDRAATAPAAPSASEASNTYGRASLAMWAGRTSMSMASSPSTVALTELIATEFAAASKLTKPRVLKVGVDRQFAELCNNLRLTWDVAVMTRRISEAELIGCQVQDYRLIEAQLGYQVLVIAGPSNYGTFALTQRDLYLALAKRIPDPSDDDLSIDNPYRSWYQVNDMLAPKPIEVRGPPLDSPLGEAFLALMIEAGCDTDMRNAQLKETNLAGYEQACHSLREDGVYQAVVRPESWAQMQWQPNRVNIVDRETQRRNWGLGIPVFANDRPLTMTSIVEGEYPAARPIYLYINADTARRVPIVREFLRHVVSEESFGPSGYLARAGLTVLSTQQRNAIRNHTRQFRELTTLTKE